MKNHFSKKCTSLGFIFLILICFCIISCYAKEPGYGVIISFNESSKASESDIELITSFLKTNPYEVLMEKNDGKWGVLSYKILLPQERFQHIKHRYIIFVVEYYYDIYLETEKKILRKMEVRFGNSWEGRDLILKNEIDRISEHIEKVIAKRFQNSTYSIVKRYESPM